jgi:hypothetical protein
MWEKYNVTTATTKVESGLYGQLPGFGWTFGVFKQFAQALRQDSQLSQDTLYLLPGTKAIIDKTLPS